MPKLISANKKPILLLWKKDELKALKQSLERQIVRGKILRQLIKLPFNNKIQEFSYGKQSLEVVLFLRDDPFFIWHSKLKII